MPATLEPTLIAFGSFVIIAIAAKWIGGVFSRFGLPYITGYLLAGMLAGPFILDLMSTEDTERLRFVDELSLAVIAFIAGSELYLKELRSRIRPILLNTAGLVAVAPILIGIVLFIATDFISFTDDFNTNERIAVALLGATILLALSPASTIAVIQEVRARGSFTKTILSITVVMDVIIIVFFAISAAFAAALLDGDGLSPAFLLALVLDLIIAVVSGIAIGNLLKLTLSTKLHQLAKTAIVLALGLVIFIAAFEVTAITKDAGFELHLEPLLISMIAGFYVTNYTDYRRQFDGILHDVSPVVYVAFFALTGVALKLDILLATIGIAGTLFVVRMFSIFLGSYIGGLIAGEPLAFRQTAWMGLITQAGIALGLAREVSVEFSSLGDDFATLVISVVVLNEIFGPMFLKYALRRIGESNEPAVVADDQIRNAVILGVEGQSLALARQLKQHHWQVIVADTDREHVERLTAEDVDERHILEISYDTLKPLLEPSTDSLIAMLDDDAANLEACTLAYEKFGVRRIIARLNDLSHMDALKELGALVVNPTTAMVNLLDQYVRTPQSASLFMHDDPSYDIAQITISNIDVDGTLVRDLRLPNDVLILEIARNGHAVVPNGYSPVHYEDELTLVGKPQSLQEVTVRLGY